MEVPFFNSHLLESLIIVIVPVLFVTGSHDRLFCNSIVLDCTNEEAVRLVEQPFYLNTPDFQVYVLQQSGHDINLANNTHLYQQRVVSWLQDSIDV